MTNKEIVAVVLAEDEGKSIQVKHKVDCAGHGWTIKNVSWDWNFVSCLYRIAPSPREKWYPVFESGRVYNTSVDSLEEARRDWPGVKEFKCFREVMEDKR